MLFTVTTGLFNINAFLYHRIFTSLWFCIPTSHYSCINKALCLLLFLVLSALPVQPWQAAKSSLPPFSYGNSQAVWSWHVWKISDTSGGDWRIGNTKTSATKAIPIALNPISLTMEPPILVTPQPATMRSALSTNHPSLSKTSMKLINYASSPG